MMPTACLLSPSSQSYGQAIRGWQWAWRGILSLVLVAMLLLISGIPVSAQGRDMSAQNAILKVVNLGTEDGQLVFDPNKLIFRSGTLYTLKLVNPSPLKHYFTAKDFADAIWTKKVEVAGTEIKGHINNVELKPGATLEWTFLPIKTGSYPVICTIIGHQDAGMVGQIMITGSN